MELLNCTDLDPIITLTPLAATAATDVIAHKSLTLLFSSEF